MRNLRNVNPEDIKNKGVLGRALLDFLLFFGKTFNYFNTVINPSLKSKYTYVISVIQLNYNFL